MFHKFVICASELTSVYRARLKKCSALVVMEASIPHKYAGPRRAY